MNFIQITMNFPDATLAYLQSLHEQSYKNAKSLLKLGMWHSLEIQSLDTLFEDAIVWKCRKLKIKAKPCEKP